MTTTNTTITTGTRVNAIFTDGNTYPGVIAKAYKNGHFLVEFDDGDRARVTNDKVSIRRRGRKAIIDTHDAETIAAQIDDLLVDLANAADRKTKMAIRRRLRARGHTGGLRNIDIA